jgi:hypothetical protein
VGQVPIMNDMRHLDGYVRFFFAATAGAVLTVGGMVPAASGATMGGQQRSHATTAAPAQFGNPAGDAFVPRAARAVSTRHPDQVIGHGTPAGCTSAAVVRAVAKGGLITFKCGPKPVTITMHATAKVENTSHLIVLNGGGLVTLKGGGKHRILYMNTCDQKQTWTTSHCQNQEWPHLVVENLTFENANSTVKQTATSNYGGGAIFDLGGRLKVVNTAFIDNRCYRVGPDLGGAAIRSLEQFRNRPVYITKDTFRGGRCSNGSALSSIGVSWAVLNSVFTNNDAIGDGANPAPSGSPGGGSGGAIYCDGDHYVLKIEGTVMRNNHAREGGGAIFFVSDNNTGTMTIKNSTLHHNPSAGFQTMPGIFFQSFGHPPTIIHSTIN